MVTSENHQYSKKQLLYHMNMTRSFNEKQIVIKTDSCTSNPSNCILSTNTTLGK